MEKIAEESEYMGELLEFLSCEYGFDVTEILPAKRGFYGETWDIQTEERRYFLKIDFWNHHKAGYQSSLSAVRYITDSGISFVPKIISTKGGHLYGSFRQGTAAVFEHVTGELSEDWSAKQLFGCLAKIYRLETEGIALETENFGTDRLDEFQSLRCLPQLPFEVKQALAEKESAIHKYGEGLKRFSAVCKDHKENFHITHGDAGGNCILKEDRLFLVDWDSCLLAPIERDAWIFLCDREEMETIQSVLEENGIDYRLERNRLCYYCYDFFFYYLNAYLKSIAEAESGAQKEEISGSLVTYLTDSWIYQRLEAADLLQ